MYLGGSHKEDESLCLKVSDSGVLVEPLLWCSHEEADDRILFHFSHGVKVGKFTSVLIASPDTDVLVSSIYQFGQLIYFDLKKLWFITGRSSSRSIVPVHNLFDVMEHDVIDILPAVHALTGCDTTSKVGTKAAALKTAAKYGFELLHLFGKAELTDEMIINADKFLLRCISSNEKLNNFDELRHEIYHKKQLKFDVEKIPPTSNSIQQHVRRAHLPSYIWLHAPFMTDIAMDPLEFGYTMDEKGLLVPEILSQPKLPDDFPVPCNCLKCARVNVCPCRVRHIPCCQFCKCKAGELCKNSHKL